MWTRETIGAGGWILAAMGLAGFVAGAQASGGPATAPSADKEAATKAFELRMAGDVDQARRILDRALSADDSSAVLWFESARLHFYMCEFDKASDAIGKAIRQDNQNPRYHAWAGEIATYNAVWKSQGPLAALAVGAQMSKARKAFERAVELKEDYHQARFELINLYWQNPGRDEAKAREHLEELKRLDPVFAAQAQCLLIGKASPDEHVALWRKVVADNSKRADACVGLGRAYLLAKQYKEAVEQFSAALKLDPSQTTVLFDIARCHQGTADINAQAESYQQYLDLKSPGPLPARLKAMRYLASAEEKRGNKDRAKALRQEADKMDPRFGKRGAVRDDVPDLYTKP